MDIRNLQTIRDTVFRSFETIRDGEYDFLGDRRESVFEARSVLERLIGKIEARLIRDVTFNPWAGFRIADGDSIWPAESRHRTVALNEAPATSVGIVHGSFDPFHLGHLMMGLDAVADGSCSFSVFMPNADRAAGGTSLKPNKSSHSWRMRTVFAGGTDDFFPLTRASTFGCEGDTVCAYGRLIAENRELVEQGDGLDLVVIIGSDITLRPDFIVWTNPAYGRIRDAAPPGKIRIRFRVVERPGQDMTPDGRPIRDILDRLDFPWSVVPEISCASSSSIRQDRSAAWLYPRAITLLEAFLLYSTATDGGPDNAVRS
jgi:hypothetical protein